MILSCLIVDDEPLSQDVLKDFVKETPMLNLCGICSDAMEAIEFLQGRSVDLLFLDINMPRLSGISFAKSLEHPPMIIFTTAYAEYAVEGFELAAVDYLMKPIAFDRFLRAVNKAAEHRRARENKNNGNYAKTKMEDDFLLIRADKKIYKVEKEHVDYIESIGDYVKIFTREKTIIAADTLKNLEGILSGYCIRIHKSYIVSKQAIKYIEGNQVRVRDQMLPIGQKYREDFLNIFKTYIR